MPDELRDEIEVAAYYVWQDRMRNPDTYVDWWGKDDDWYKAKGQIIPPPPDAYDHEF